MTAAGAAAGAADGTVLNIVTYLDMVVRARPASSAPEDVIKKLAVAIDTEVPGSRRGHVRLAAPGLLG